MERIVHTLPNGLRIVAERIEGNVSYIGVLTNAGSRDDGPGKDGLAHFVEHTLFKGTAKRRSGAVSARMESVGGELNAYTTKEEIMLYTNSPAGYEARAIELLADLVKNASFPQEEINREKSVILEEIHSYRDNPSYAVFDSFDEKFFAGSPLAHNILGYPDTVERLERSDAAGFISRNFAASNMVIYCVAPSDPQKNIRLIQRHFGDLPAGAPRDARTRPLPAAPFDITERHDNHQANVLAGTSVFNIRDDRRFALYLLSNYLGGPAMNSVLNLEMRDRRGLVYTVETCVSLYSDSGVFQVYFGCEPSKVEKCSRIVRRELEKLASSPLSDKKFAMAKRQLCGQLLVSGDHRENCAMGYAKSLMRHGRVLDNADTARSIRSLEAEDIRSLAEEIVSTPFSRLVLI